MLRTAHLPPLTQRPAARFRCAYHFRHFPTSVSVPFLALASGGAELTHPLSVSWMRMRMAASLHPLLTPPHGIRKSASAPDSQYSRNLDPTLRIGYNADCRRHPHSIRKSVDPPPGFNMRGMLIQLCGLRI